MEWKKIKNFYLRTEYKERRNTEEFNLNES